MKGKTTIMLLMTFIMMMVMAIGVQATDVGLYYNGTTTFNGKVVLSTNSVAEPNVTACNFTFSANNAENTGVTVLFENTSCDDNANCTYEVDTSALDDSTNYTIDLLCDNGTGPNAVTNSSALSSIVIDNNEPSTPTFNENDKKSFKTKDFSYNVTVTGEDTVACYYVFETAAFPGTQRTHVVNNTGDTCVGYFGKLPDGVYSLTVSAWDGTNFSSNSSFQEFSVEGGKQASTAGKLAAMAAAGIDTVNMGGEVIETQSFFDGMGGETNTSIIPWIIGGILIYLIFNKKKKK